MFCWPDLDFLEKRLTLDEKLVYFKYRLSLVGKMLSAA